MATASLLTRVVGFFSSLVDDLLADEESHEPRKAKRSQSRAQVASKYPLISQDDETGCGVACIAMLAGKDYAEVKAVLFASKRKRVFYTGYKELRNGLKEFGLELEGGRARKFTGFRDIDATAIVAVEQSPPVKSRWHWVVFVRDGRRSYVLDPSWEGTVRTDLQRLKGRHSLRIVELAALAGTRKAHPSSRRATTTARTRTTGG